MMLLRSLFVITLLLITSVAHASWYICGDVTGLKYFGAADPSRIPPCPAPYAVSLVPEGPVLTAQMTLYDSLQNKRHIKVVGVAPNALMQEMTQAEKDVVDLPAQQQAAAQDVAKAEMAGNEVCANHTLPQITEYWKGAGGKQSQLQALVTPIDASLATLTTDITTLTTAINALSASTTKTALQESRDAIQTSKNTLQALRDALVPFMTMFINDSELAWRFICSHKFVRP